MDTTPNERFPGRRVAVGPLRIHYEEEGSTESPPVLLVHGLMASTAIWRTTRRRLGQRFRLIMVDLVGHGYSDRRDDFSMSLSDQADMVARFLDVIDVRPRAVVGHSMGGGVSLILAARYPQLFEQLVVADSVCFPFSLPWLGRLAVNSLFGAFLVTHLYRRPILARHMRTNVHLDPRFATEEEIDTVYAHFNSPVGRRAIFRAMSAVAHPDSLPSFLPWVRAPTLVLWGDHDRLVPVPLGERLVRSLPDARWETISQCGHEPMTEQPDRFCAAIERYLAGSGQS